MLCLTGCMRGAEGRYHDRKERPAALRRIIATYGVRTLFDLPCGNWRIINLGKPPFNFPPPLEIVNENCIEGRSTFTDKSLGLYRPVNTLLYALIK
jgi:hypothetical protein